MDTGETYIKQCARAEEIQKLQTFTQVWLPRQDQLQAMVLPLKDDDLGELHFDFNLFVEIDCISKLGDYRLREYKSYEQLWLAFVMKELYHKKWDSEKEDWIG